MSPTRKKTAKKKAAATGTKKKAAASGTTKKAAASGTKKKAAAKKGVVEKDTADLKALKSAIEAAQKDILKKWEK